jgi:ACS family hexuronate transporter-like MFS transporter
LWGVIAARLVSDPLWFFFLYWEPGYLQERLGMSLGELAKIGWIPTAVATAVLIALGFISDRFVMRLGWQPARSRRVVLQALAAFAPVLILLPYVHNHALVIVLLCLVRVMMVVWLNFTNLLMADLVPSNLIGTAIALMSAFGAATGLLCNVIVGPVLDTIGYGVVFVAGACLHPLAAFILWRCYGRGKGGRTRS